METLNFPLLNNIHNPLNQAKSGLVSEELFLSLSFPQLWASERQNPTMQDA